MRKNAARADDVPSNEPSAPLIFSFCISLTSFCRRALFARAMTCAFLPRASDILPSKACIPSYSLSILAACMSICSCSESAVSSSCCLRAKASRARSSLPYFSASEALLNHLVASASEFSLCFISFLCVTVTSAYDALILARSLDISVTAWLIIFSGSSNDLRKLFMFAFAIRAERSPRLIDKVVVIPLDDLPVGRDTVREDVDVDDAR
mmetsp:Transcript_7507/g.15673  ORF Transcript_7507/g.15673 Transcript_7507/m.15673 type:complete len:209 (+) Transcript_7507:408-1034(+)